MWITLCLLDYNLIILLIQLHIKYCKVGAGIEFPPLLSDLVKQNYTVTVEIGKENIEEACEVYKAVDIVRGAENQGNPVVSQHSGESDDSSGEVVRNQFCDFIPMKINSTPFWTPHISLNLCTNCNVVQETEVGSAGPDNITPNTAKSTTKVKVRKMILSDHSEDDDEHISLTKLQTNSGKKIRKARDINNLWIAMYDQ